MDQIPVSNKKYVELPNKKCLELVHEGVDSYKATVVLRINDSRIRLFYYLDKTKCVILDHAPINLLREYNESDEETSNMLARYDIRYQ